MLRSITLILSLSIYTSLLAQDRHLRNAIDAITDNDQLKAVEKLNTYFNKKGATPPYYYVKYLLQLQSASAPNEFDSAYRFLSLATEGQTELTDKEQKEWCKEIEFCKDNLNEQLLSLDTAVYISYAKANSIELINDFIKKHPQSKLIKEAKELKSHLSFLIAQNVNSEKAYAEFLAAFPYGNDVPIAKNRMWELGYAAAKKENTVASYEKFILKYPESNLVKESENAIRYIIWEQTLASNTLKAYESFLEKYPNAPQKEEAQHRIWDIAWEGALRANTKQSFHDYTVKYPTSPKTQEANERIEEISWKEAFASGKADAIQEFLLTYPHSKKISLAKRELERIEWENVKNEYQLVNVENFLKKYPSTIYKEEADRLMEEIRSEILPYLTRNRTYKLYNVVSKSFVTEEEYQMISPLKGGLYLVQQNEKMGLIDKEGNNLILITYDCLEPLSSNRYKVLLAEKYGVVDQAGENIINLNYNSIDTVQGGMYIVSKSAGEYSKYGLLDANGQSLLDAKYDELKYVKENCFIATLRDVSFLINISGDRIGNLTFSYANIAENNSIIAVQKNKYGVIDIKGSLILPFGFENISIADTGWFIVSLPGEKTGIYNRQGKETLAPLTASIRHLIKDVFVITPKGSKAATAKAYLFNASLKKSITNPVYDEILEISEDLCAFRENKFIGYMNTDGKTIIDPRYSDFDYNDIPPAENYAEGEDDGGYSGEDICYGVYNYFGNGQLWYTTYSKSLSFSGGLAVLYTGGKEGYIDRKGKIVIPVIYDHAFPFINGIATVVLNSTYKVINTKGETLLDGYKIVSFSEDRKKCVSENIESKDIALLDLTTMDVTELPSGVTSYSLHTRYGMGYYKDVYVYFSKRSELLMDEEIDFSEYEANKIIGDALRQYEAQNYPEAIELYKKALDADIKKEEALLGLARSHIANEEKSYGKQYLNELIEMQPESAIAYEERGNLNYDMGEFSEALDDLNNAVANGIYANADLYFRIAYCEAMQGNNPAAIQNYTESLKLSAYSMSYNNRGACHQALGNLSLALKDFSSAISTSKDTDDKSKGLYYNNRGVLLVNMKKKSEACYDFKKAANYGNENAKINIRSYCR